MGIDGIRRASLTPEQRVSQVSTQGRFKKFFVNLGKGIAKLFTSPISFFRSLFSRRVRVEENPQPRLNRLTTLTDEERLQMLHEKVEIIRERQDGKLTQYQLLETQTYKDMKFLVEKEAKKTFKENGLEGAAGTMLRVNSDATRYLLAFSKGAGEGYVHGRLSRVIGQMEELGELEINPNKLGDEVKREKNLEGLRGLYRNLMEDIIGAPSNLEEALDRVPQQICDQLKLINDTVYSLAKENGATDELAEKIAKNAVVGTFFLRFVTPSIVNFSKERGIPNRTFAVIASVLQAQANGLEFSDAKPHMQPFNDLLREYQEPFNRFIEGIVERGNPPSLE